MVADTRHVSVHEILSPSPVWVYAGEHPKLGRYRIDFDPFAGWSWRELIVWSADANRQHTEQTEARESAEWRTSAMQDLERRHGF